MQNIVSIAAGNECSMALDNKGYIYRWGNLNLLNFQVPSNKQVTYIDSAFDHSLMVLSGGSVIMIGRDKDRSLVTRSPTPVVIK